MNRKHLRLFFGQVLSLSPPHRGVPEAQGPHVRRLVDVAQVHQHEGANQGRHAFQVEGAEGVPFGDDDQDIGAFGGGVGVGAEVDAGKEAARLRRPRKSGFRGSDPPPSRG